MKKLFAALKKMLFGKKQKEEKTFDIRYPDACAKGKRRFEVSKTYKHKRKDGVTRKIELIVVDIETGDGKVHRSCPETGNAGECQPITIFNDFVVPEIDSEVEYSQEIKLQTKG